MKRLAPVIVLIVATTLSPAAAEIVLKMGSDDKSSPQFGRFSEEVIREFTVDSRVNGTQPAFTNGFEVAALFSNRYARFQQRKNEALAARYASEATDSRSAVIRATDLIFDIEEKIDSNPRYANLDSLYLENWAQHQQVQPRLELETGSNTTQALFTSARELEGATSDSSPFQARAYSKQVIESQDLPD